VALSYTNCSINLQSGNGVLVETKYFTNGSYTLCFKAHLYDIIYISSFFFLSLNKDPHQLHSPSFPFQIFSTAVIVIELQ